MCHSQFELQFRLLIRFQWPAPEKLLTEHIKENSFPFYLLSVYNSISEVLHLNASTQEIGMRVIMCAKKITKIEREFDQ